MRVQNILLTCLLGIGAFSCKTEQPEGPAVGLGLVSFDPDSSISSILKQNPLKTLTNGTFYGTVQSSGNLEIKRGMIWSDSSNNPTMADARDTIFADEGKVSNLGKFSKAFPIDRNNSTIYYRLFVENARGVAYTEAKSFQTQKGAPLPKMQAIADFPDTIALLQGAVVLDGGSTITERGFVIGTGTAPTITNVKIVVPGNETGPFQISQSVKKGFLPSRKYYVRAYAQNADGLTGYGGLASFTTKE